MKKSERHVTKSKEGRETAKRRKKRKLLISLLVFAFLGIGVLLSIGTVRGTNVIVSPTEASVNSEISIIQGLGFVTSDKIYSLFGNLVFEVNSPGYVTHTQEVTQSKISNYLEVVMRESLAVLSLTTSPQVPDTQWFIDGGLVGTGDSLSLEKASGEYLVEARNDFYTADSVSVTVARAEKKELTIQFHTVSGSLNITSNPNDIDVLLDGEKIGKTPLSSSLLAGEYVLEINHSSYEEVKETIRISNDRLTLNRAYRLQPKQASLSFELSPQDGTLYVDGRQIEQLTNLPVNSLTQHRILYQYPGHEDYSQDVELEPSENLNIVIALEPEFGVVEVNSTPIASVYVDGKEAGETPLSLTLNAVEHTIVITKSQYRSMEYIVLPSSGDVKTLEGELISELESRRRESPINYVNSAGVSMTRYRPDAFTMGAPRSEKGQRANEFVRNILLTKEFYVSTTEITERQFAQSLGASASGNRQPKTNVSWYDAVLYCNWLSTQENLTPVYKFNGGQYVEANVAVDGYRLPTEAEWEWLARKANRQNQTKFVWGNDVTVPKSSGNLADEDAKNAVSTSYIGGYKDGFAQVAPVASFDIEKSGLYDLSGNVSEWVHDYYNLIQPDVGAVELNPAGSDRGEGHVIKGSSWRSATLSELRASYRDSHAGSRDDVGFRVVRYLYGAENED